MRASMCHLRIGEFGVSFFRHMHWRVGDQSRADSRDMASHTQGTVVIKTRNTGVAGLFRV